MRDNLVSSMRGRVHALGLLLMAAVTLVPSAASADSARIQFLSGKLSDSDFRVRTQAALSLGGENDDAAVQPLCGALSDSNETVRGASAAALKRLGRQSALGCLNTQLGNESSDTVKAQINRAIQTIQGNGGGGGGGGGGGDSGTFTPKENSGAKYYIGLSSVSNETTRGQPEVEAIVLKAMRAKLESAGTVQLAPMKESPDDAKAAMKKRGIKNGFYLSIAVSKFDYSGGNLKVKIKVGVFKYPGKSLLGNVDKSLTQEGVSSGDKASEDKLLDLAAGLASKQFTDNADAFLD